MTHFLFHMEKKLSLWPMGTRSLHGDSNSIERKAKIRVIWSFKALFSLSGEEEEVVFGDYRILFDLVFNRRS